jgi:hypothetical protein
LDDLPSSISPFSTQSSRIPENHGPVPATRAVARRASRDHRLPAAAFPAATGVHGNDESTFLELRRKVQSGELLSASTERLLGMTNFTGHLTVVVQHGRVVKSGYEEGYCRRKHDPGARPCEYS